MMLLVASETGHVYTFATKKLQPIITSEAGKALIQTWYQNSSYFSMNHLLYYPNSFLLAKSSNLIYSSIFSVLSLNTQDEDECDDKQRQGLHEEDIEETEFTYN